MTSESEHYTWFLKIIRFPMAHQFCLLMVTMILFIPFSGKPFHIDSPVTVYVAKQIIENPLNPPAGHFGRLLSVWNATRLPSTSAFHATPHPPLLSYYTAFIISIFGDSERVINWSFFPFYAGLILLFFTISRYLGIRNRFTGTLLFAVSPVVLVNAQNVMYDVPLAMFCIGGFYWMFRCRNTTGAVLAGIFVGCACLVKFTAGTMVIAGMVHFILKKQWRYLLIFVLIAGVLNALWLVHNLILFHAWQLTQNGHAKYLLGDIRYRFERMVSYIGGSAFFPVFPVVLWWLSKSFRRSGIMLGIGTFTWSVLLSTVLKYSFPSALFFWCCSFAGILLILQFYRAVVSGQWAPAGSSTDRSETSYLRVNYTTLSIHTLLQMLGGGFLTLYAVRYTLPFIFTFFIFFLFIMESVLTKRNRRIFTISVFATSLTVSVLLSVSDFQLVNAERQIAMDCASRYPCSTVFYNGRLGYLYYMDRAGAISFTDTSVTPEAGAIAVENCFYRDDLRFINSCREQLSLIDSSSYPVWPLRTIGGRSGFYGNDRLPYAFDWSALRRKFRIYRFME
ncbi:MAG: glycosyltransferase family 39 protein [Chitinispirillaceae bacterium]|nr:glycosyltransferase family 39 protein [Chitinispirillaceae bacterium]